MPFAAAFATLAGSLHDIAGTISHALGPLRRTGSGLHPIDAIADPCLAAGGLTVAFLALGPRPSTAGNVAHLRALQSHLGATLREAEEILLLGDWFLRECPCAEAAAIRLAERLRRLAGPAALDPALRAISDVARARGGLTDPQRRTLAAIRRIFGR